MDIKAIETQYKGYRFRSRLEARWAVFFDSLGLEWEYEKEGFNLDGGIKYLPDFYLKDPECWVEIKPEWTNERYDRIEFEKAGLLAAQTKQWVNIVNGNPWPEEYTITSFHHKYPPEEIEKYVDLAIENNDEFLYQMILRANSAYYMLDYQKLANEKRGWFCPDGLYEKTYHVFYEHYFCYCEKHKSLSVGSTLHSTQRCSECGSVADIGKPIFYTRCFSGEKVGIYDCDQNKMIDNETLNNAYRAARSARFEHGESGYALG